MIKCFPQHNMWWGRDGEKRASQMDKETDRLVWENIVLGRSSIFLSKWHGFESLLSLSLLLISFFSHVPISDDRYS